MYSMVLMAAVATSGDAASFHKKSAGCNGCSGAPVVVRSAPVIYSVGCYGYSQPFGSCTGCRGCTGCSGSVTYFSSCFGCCGGSGWSCTGGSGCCGGIVNWSSPVIETSVPAHSPAVEDKKKTNLEIELPSDATLFVDGRMIPGSGSVRSFTTPELPAGKSYYYDMKAEVTVNGTVQREEHRVVVRAGETLKQSFGELIAKTKVIANTGVAQK